MTNYQQKKSLSVMTQDELHGLIREYNLGGSIDYDVKNVYGEILFRDMMNQWNNDTEDLEEAERERDQGCGHDQNEGYYDKED